MVAFQKHANDFKGQTPGDNIGETALVFFPKCDVD